MPADGESLLGRVVSSIASRGGDGNPSSKDQKSILSQAAASYANKPDGAESTIPTGFDPRAASLFEAVIEAAFLVANADGVFDDTERQTFEQVVVEACQNAIQMNDVSALVSDLLDQVQEDGVDQRVQMVTSVVHTDEHRHEVLRISALMAHISGGVDQSERAILEKIATGFGLDSAAVEQAITAAKAALGD